MDAFKLCTLFYLSHWHMLTFKVHIFKNGKGKCQVKKVNHSRLRFEMNPHNRRDMIQTKATHPNRSPAVFRYFGEKFLSESKLWSSVSPWLYFLGLSKRNCVGLQTVTQKSCLSLFMMIHGVPKEGNTAANIIEVEGSLLYSSGYNRGIKINMGNTPSKQPHSL